MALLSFNTSEESPATAIASVLAIGPWDRGEFALLSSKLNTRGDWIASKSCEAAAKLLIVSQLAPQFIAIAQPLPGDVSHEEIEQLRQAAPLAQIIIVAGSWCEGELRTGQPPEGVLRMYWHEFANWWPTRMQTDWSACLDGSLAARGSKPSSHSKTHSVTIHSPTFASFEAISSVLAPLGSQTTWARDVSKLPAELSTGIWDGGQLDAQELTELKLFASEIQRQKGKLVVLLDFPRKEHFELLHELGCRAVLGKPYVIEELVAACVS